MASFAYTAINAQGLEMDGVISAADLTAAREQLRVRGLLAQQINEVGTGAGVGSKNISFGQKKVKPKSLQIFSRQFATMIEAGLNVVGALVILEEQTSDEALSAIVGELRRDVEGGLLLSEAMARHPRVFTRLYISMVEAGEAAGILDIVLDRVAFQIEKQEAIRRRIKGAMVYPTMVMIFATLVLVGMLMFLVPVFVKIFSQLGGQLPTLTQYVVTVSDLLKNKPYVLLIIPLSLWSFFRWKKTEKGRQNWDKFKLKLPMKIGDVVLKVSMARFSRTLSTLVAAGVDIIKALEITGQTSGNWVIEDALAGVRTKVHEGVPIAQPLVENEIFPPMVSQMVKIGEETGELEKMLGKIADFYEDEVDASVQSLTSIVEPIMMIGVGIMVGIVIISMYLPMFKMLTLVK
ncbi:MAG TPA: type II secretion system F family protein [Gaiellaceae bacterium]|jgi:type IV pilus assembly protein PilC|nr:type II secretion system F family protein [Gaiellaceae bacterium]